MNRFAAVAAAAGLMVVAGKAHVGDLNVAALLAGSGGILRDDVQAADNR
jgi:hypothetical protein